MKQKEKIHKALYLFFGILLFSMACEDKAGHPDTLSRPTIPDNKGINKADTSLNYNSEFKDHKKNDHTEDSN